MAGSTASPLSARLTRGRGGQLRRLFTLADIETRRTLTAELAAEVEQDIKDYARL